MPGQAPRKPRALPGGTGKKERQRIKSERGAMHPRPKKEKAPPQPTLAQIYAGIYGKEIDRVREYAFFNLFTARERKALLRLGYTPNPQKYPRKDPEKNPFFEQDTRTALLGLERAKQHINRVAFTMKTLSKADPKAEYVHHTLQGYVIAPLKTQIEGRQRRNAKKE